MGTQVLNVTSDQPIPLRELANTLSRAQLTNTTCGVHLNMTNCLPVMSYCPGPVLQAIDQATKTEDSSGWELILILVVLTIIGCGLLWMHDVPTALWQKLCGQPKEVEDCVTGEIDAFVVKRPIGKSKKKIG